MVRMPKALVALVMAFALFAQATAGCACAIGCLLGTCSSKHSESSHHEEKESEKACCDHEKQPDADHHSDQGHKGSSSQDDGCGCPELAACDFTVPTTVTASLTSFPVFDALAVLPESLEVPIELPQVQEPGHFGNDSGPPPRVPAASSSPRAPPVA